MPDHLSVFGYDAQADWSEGDCACPEPERVGPDCDWPEQDCACPEAVSPRLAGLHAGPATATASTLTAWLHVTTRCNLRCAYCYAPPGRQEMAEATGHAAIEAVFRAARRHGFREIKLKYGGGEPALNLPLVYSLHRRAQALAARDRMALRAVLLSNGVALDDDTLRAVRDAGIRLALSLDGIGAVHDAQRGPGTFQQVAATIERAVALGLRPHLSITVTAINAGGLGEVASFALQRGLPFNLNFYREHACAFQGSSLAAQPDQLIDGVRAALTEVQEIWPVPAFTGGMLDRANCNFAHRRPCGAGHSYLAIDCQGRVARCHMDLDGAVGTVWDDDPLAAVCGVAGSWRNLDVDARQGCSACDWRYWCGGGCPLLTHRVAGRDDVPSPYCRVYRTLLPELRHLQELCLLDCSPPVA